jgi:hypothetical protein
VTSYAAVQELKGWISAGDTDTADDPVLQHCLDAATLAIEQATGRRFVYEAGVAKVFDAASPTRLDVVDLIGATAVAVDSNGDGTFATALTAAQWYGEPAWVPDSAGPRYQALVISPTSTAGYWLGIGRRVRVTGNWGYVVGDYAAGAFTNAAPPPGIRLACLILAARTFKRREAPFGILQSVDLGQFARLSAADPDVASLLKPYEHPRQSWVLV